MQIHELNNYDGNLDSGAFLAVDNGSDTGKVNVTRLLNDVNESIEAVEEDLNGRIDNIIAGGDAPSAAEIIDARHGVTELGGVNYPSLGDAIRGQVSDLLEKQRDTLTVDWWNIVKEPPAEEGVFYNGLTPGSSSSYFSYKEVPVEPDTTYYAYCESYDAQPTVGARFVNFLTESKTLISTLNSGNDNTRTFITPVNCAYITITFAYVNGLKGNYYLTNKVPGDRINYYNTQGNILKNDSVEGFDEIENKFLVTEGDVIDENTAVWLNGYLNISNGDFVPSNSTFHTTDFIELPKNVLYGVICEMVLSGDIYKFARVVCVYNSDKSWSRSITGNGNHTHLSVYLTGDEKYVRINLNFDTLTSFSLYRGTIGANNKKTELNDVTLNVKCMPYVRARRPIISFVLDGDYNMNDDMEAVFSNHNVRAGFAPPYDGSFQTIPLITYMDWQVKGHEILVHSGKAVGTQGSYTDQQIAQIIKDCYDTFVGYGFDLHGFVALQGNTKPVAVENVKKYFDYGFDALNHAPGYPDGRDESNLYVSADSPYMLWRYSMQLASLQEMKDAVDKCHNTNGLLIFYGHAMSTNTDYFTTANLDALLSYIESVGVEVKTPYEAIKDYYSFRWDDVFA